MFDNQTKRFCSAVVDALPNLSEEEMQYWIGDPKGLQKVLKWSLPFHQEAMATPEDAVVMKRILRKVKDVVLATTAAKMTGNCFTDDARYYYREDVLDSWLPMNQQAKEGQPFSVCELSERATFMEMAQIGRAHV